MKIAWIIAKREFTRYFTTPIAYSTAFFYLLVIGFIFYVNLTGAVANQVPPGVDSVIGLLVFLLLFATPATTMHLLAEEQRMGTIELLLTAPIRDWQLIIGKWLGSFLFLSSLVLVTLIYPLIINQMVDPGIDLGPLFTGYLGIFLVVGSFAAIGVLISSLGSNQTVAFFFTLGALLILWIVSAPAQSSPVGNELLSYLDFRRHFYTNFFVGVIDLKDVVYYLSLTSLSLFLGTVFVEARRWR